MIENWEEENADIFMVYDERYIEVIETQRAMYQERKEMHKVLRVCINLHRNGKQNVLAESTGLLHTWA